MTTEEYQAAARYWEEKDAVSVKLEQDTLRAMVEKYIQSNNTCALATGTGDYVRCTPIEYSWHDHCFWMFSEGGKKFIGLGNNPHVCLAIYDRYTGFGTLHGMQITGWRNWWSRSAILTTLTPRGRTFPWKLCAGSPVPCTSFVFALPASNVCFRFQGAGGLPAANFAAG